mmetsp:Transcript_12610/g.38032  ORF Transcript_12610/g.38032 Transcript_12610/m.38032 type:complete len:329 (+) Transcript_12610:134-1120(+)
MTVTVEDQGEMEAFPLRSRPQPTRSRRRREDPRDDDKRRRVEKDEDDDVYTAASVRGALESVREPAERTAFLEHVLPRVGPAGPPTLRPARVRLRFERESLFVVGRYRKLSRAMPQSPWTVSKDSRSVEEVLRAVVGEQTACAEVKFRASGREDVDVRMLGTGRPFSLQIVNPEKALFDADAATRALSLRDGLVQVLDLRVSDRNAAHAVDADVQARRKTYVCVVWFEKALRPGEAAVLNATTDLDVHQKTPVRVMHSRSLATRRRCVHSLHLELLNAHFGVLRLCTAAGTYVKEFVHGDFGRTTPSLGSLLHTRADILQLDVIHVDD